MCGRYTLYDIEDLAERFDVEIPGNDLQENYNVAPSQIMPVIVNDEADRHLEYMRWGLIPKWAKDARIGYKLINARSESIFEKPVWRHIIRTKRCLVPANGFYEWKRTDSARSKQPFYLHPKQERLFAFAGVWESWENPEHQIWKTYSIITTEPNQEASAIHNRMPVILHKEEESFWIDATNDRPEDIEPLLQPYEDNGLELYPVGTGINTPRNNQPTLIQPLH